MAEKAKGKWYYVVLAAPIYFLMLLPFPILYLLSDFLYLIMYYVIGYRKKVVYQNLRNSFPQKTDEEIAGIAKAYYQFMIDLFIETFKTLTLSKRELMKRCTYAQGALEMSEHYYLQKRSIMMVMGHYGNWEWGGHVFSQLAKHGAYALYHPVKSPFFNWLTSVIRTKFGIGLINMHHSIKQMITLRHELTATAFIADQTPSNPKEAYWTNFLHQDTPVLLGTELIAGKLNYPVIFASVRRKKRGYYEVHFELITDQPAVTKPGEITEKHCRLLEAEINRQPEIWLWSHRRWKHKRPH